MSIVWHTMVISNSYDHTMAIGMAYSDTVILCWSHDSGSNSSHKPPMTGNGEHTNYGNDWGTVSYCYTHISNSSLVAGFNSSEKCKSVGMMKFPMYGKMKNVPNHQPVVIYRVIEWYYVNLIVVVVVIAAIERMVEINSLNLLKLGGPDAEFAPSIHYVHVQPSFKSGCRVQWFPMFHPMYYIAWMYRCSGHH